tara:strand:+ start:3267 stop:3881 length:615 start_codon:yes stop_codon:yes gene_type:complete
MHCLEPAGDYIRVGAEARALASQLDTNLTVADAINETAGDNLPANCQGVECYGLAFLGRLDHREVRHLFNDARDQRCLVPCDQGLATMLDNKLLTLLGQAVTDTDGRLATLGFNLGGLQAGEASTIDATDHFTFAGEDGQLARPIMHLRFGCDLSEICARLIANNAANHQLFEQLAHGSGTLARYGMGLAGDLSEAGVKIFKTV